MTKKKDEYKWDLRGYFSSDKDWEDSFKIYSDDILKVSKEMRNNIRGQDIGGLG